MSVHCHIGQKGSGMSHEVQRGWHIEHGPNERPVYLVAHPHGFGWTKDAAKACLFARIEDARAASRALNIDYGRIGQLP